MPPAELAHKHKPRAETAYAGLPFFCYPGIAQFSTGFGYRDYLQAVAGLRTRGGRNALALSLYVPAPVASGCLTADGESGGIELHKPSSYLAYLQRECEMQGQLFAGMNQIEQLTLSGPGVATLGHAQIQALMQHLRHWFQFAPEPAGAYAIDIDARRITERQLGALRDAGFNQVRLNYPAVDTADAPLLEIRRSQHQTLVGIGRVKAADFRVTRIDLMIGLPGQNLLTLSRAVAAMIDARIDRIVLPDLANASTEVELCQSRCIWQLERAGYRHLGTGYFVRAGDSLAVAQQQGRLHVNLDGFSVQADHDVVACGVSAVSVIGSAYSQNVDTLEAYYDRIDDNALPIARGVVLGMDDALRRAIMKMLMSNLTLSVVAIEQAWPINFSAYFASELVALQVLADQGLLCIEQGWISVNSRGRLSMRSICAVFDRTLTASPLPAKEGARVP